MSNTVKSWIEVHDGGKLTLEEVNLAVHRTATVDEYYGARVEKSERISLRTRYAPPVGEIARLAYAKGLSVTMEFESPDNSELGSMQFYYRREALEAMDEIGVLDYYRPGAEPRWALEMAAKAEARELAELPETFGAQDAAKAEEGQ